MNTTHPLTSTLLIAATAFLCSGLQLAGIDSLATPRGAFTDVQVVQLPTVHVITKRESSTATVPQLPQVVVVGRRSDAAPTVAAQSPAARPAI